MRNILCLQIMGDLSLCVLSDACCKALVAPIIVFFFFPFLGVKAARPRKVTFLSNI